MSAGYLNTLFGTANYIRDQLMPTERARLAAWELQARAAGVAEANIIAVLIPWNQWDQATIDLADIVIANEMIRVQNGGADGNISNFQPTAPPPLPAIAGIVTAQGGPLSGAAQFSGPISPVVSSSPITLAPASVAAGLTGATAVAGGGQVFPPPVNINLPAPPLTGSDAPLGATVSTVTEFEAGEVEGASSATAEDEATPDGAREIPRVAWIALGVLVLAFLAFGDD